MEFNTLEEIYTHLETDAYSIKRGYVQPGLHGQV